MHPPHDEKSYKCQKRAASMLVRRAKRDVSWQLLLTYAKNSGVVPPSQNVGRSVLRVPPPRGGACVCPRQRLAWPRVEISHVALWNSGAIGRASYTHTDLPVGHTRLWVATRVSPHVSPRARVPQPFRSKRVTPLARTKHVVFKLCAPAMARRMNPRPKPSYNRP